MLAFERKILEWINAKLYFFAFVAVTLLGVYIRYAVRDLESADYRSFLSLWYDLIKTGGGLQGLHTQVGNYNMLYQFLIAVMTYIPLKPLYAYKVLSCIFDFALAIVAAFLTRHLTGGKNKWSVFVAYTIVLLSPIVFLNSAGWAQCDAMYVFFVVAALLVLMKEKPALAFIMYGFAFALKLQAVLFLPFLLFIYFARRKFTALHFGWIPVVMVVTSIPCLIAGRNVKELYWMYAKQVDCYYAVHMNYPSFWAILNSAEYTENWDAFKPMAMGMAVAVLGVIMILLIAYKVDLNHRNMLYIAFVLTFATVLFLPAMHERYGYIYEILAIVILVVNRKTAPLFASLLYVTCSTYGHYLYKTPVNISVLAVINVVTFLLYCYVLGKDMLSANVREAGAVEAENGRKESD